MAVRVQNDGAMVFGIMAGAVRATHGRFQKAGSAAVIRPLSAAVAVGSGERLRVPPETWTWSIRRGSSTTTTWRPW